MPEPAPSSSHTTTTTTNSQSSPKYPFTDLGLDPSDPLNLLLHNSAQGASSSSNMNSDDSTTSQDGSPPDWSQLSNLWHNQEDGSLETKGYPELMDFSDLTSLPMDMDFGSSMAIEPSALHYDYAKHAAGFSFEEAYAATDLHYPFTFQSPNVNPGDFSTSTASSQSQSGSVRRLSITSSSSSSGASFSPMITQNQTVLQAPMQGGPYANDPAAEIAQRVRESSGVMLAVPMTSHMQGVSQGHHMNSQSPLMAQATQTKLPIPRLPRRSSEAPSKSSSSSSPSSAASTPPPATPPPSTGILSPSNSGDSTTASPPPSSSQASPQSGSNHPRPKTSHTTIERRYRTNLNARIQSLRMAVPALRVLEDRDAIASVGAGGKKVKVRVSANAVIRGIKSECIPGSHNAGINADGEMMDVIDERGFVDGVKVARKCSKANVLGKAVEYIRVLKKREHRLKAEQAGLKSLISGLVGGPALLREWEREWRDRFGGEEKDEVEGEMDGDGDDSDDDEDEDEDTAGKKRKRPRVAPAKEKKDAIPAKIAKAASQAQITLQPQVAQLAGMVQPEKRKRGRPRKVVPPPASEVSVGQPQFDQTMTTFVPQDPSSQGGQPQQYLLAVFAMFSFFNSPMTPNYTTWDSHSSHAHTGTVLSLHPPLNPDLVLPPPPTSPLATALQWTWTDYLHLFHLFVSIVVFGSVICSWAGIRAPRPLGLMKLKGLLGVRDSSSSESCSKESTKWVQQVVRRPSVVDSVDHIGFLSQVRIYRQISSHPSSIGDLCNIALGAWSWGALGRMRARAIWDRALAKAQLADQGVNVGTVNVGKAYERLVVKHFFVEEAFKTLVDMETRATDNSFEPTKELARVVVVRLVKQQLQRLFATIVMGDNDTQSDETFDAKDTRPVVDAATELGGEFAKVARIFERVLKTGGAWNDALFDEVLTLRSSSLPLSDDEATDDEDHDDSSSAREIGSLLTAIILYRRVAAELDIGSTSTTSSALLSPPPTPTVTSMSLMSRRKKSFDVRLLTRLRSALGSKAFEEEGMVEGVEDARDTVVDLVVEYQRRERRV